VKKPKKIFIYLDDGVDPFGFNQTVHFFKKKLCETRYVIEPVNSQKIIQGALQKGCALFVMPGGRDLPYLHALGKSGCEQICRYVEEGGSYLGICAGAYFASGYVDFQRGGRHEVQGERELKFFPGRAVGPAIFPKLFQYQSYAGAYAVDVLYEKVVMKVYFHGGCFFSEESISQDIEVLARYQHVQCSFPAVISLCRGKGKVILSGVHLEMSTEALIDLSSPLSEIGKDLLSDEKVRDNFFEQILAKLLL